MEMAMEPLLHKECKMKKWEDAGPRKPKEMIVEGHKEKFTSHYCGKHGNFKINFRPSPEETGSWIQVQHAICAKIDGCLQHSKVSRSLNK